MSVSAEVVPTTPASLSADPFGIADASGSSGWAASSSSLDKITSVVISGKAPWIIRKRDVSIKRRHNQKLSRILPLGEDSP
jgi:hypothetical protein